MTLLKERLEMHVSATIAVAILSYYIKGECPDRLCRVLERAVSVKRRALLRNKVLTPVSFLLADCCGYSDAVTEFRMRRHNIYMRACSELSETFEDEGMEYVIIKTMRSFPADVADIDLLVRPGNKLRAYALLRRLGYGLRKESESQSLWTKIVEGVVVDVELHTSVSIAGFSYVENDVIFSNTDVREGVRVPREDLAVVLGAAHAVMKDLEVKLADVAELAHYLLGESTHGMRACLVCALVANARALGLTTALGFVTGLGTYAYPSYAGVFKGVSRLLRSRRPVYRPSTMPVKPPLQVVLAALIEKAVTKASMWGVNLTLRELLTIVRSKGIDALTAYLSGRAVTKDVFEDMMYDKSPRPEK